MFISISNVYALTDEEELQSLIDKVPDSYDLTVEESVQFKYDINTFSYDGLYWMLLDKTYNDIFNTSFFLGTSGFSYTNNRDSLKNFANDDKYLLIDIDDNNTQYTVTLLNLKNCDSIYGENLYSDCDKRIEVSKKVDLNINKINDKTYLNEIDKMISELNDTDKYNYYNEQFNDSWACDYFTTPQTINKIMKQYDYDIINLPYAGSDIQNNDGDIDIPYHRDFLYIYKNNILYNLLFNVAMIDTTLKTSDGKYMNGYLPKLKLSDYYDVDEYIDDALVDFPSKAHLTNYEVVKQEDGKRYTKRSEDGTDYYEVLIIDLDNNVEWNMYFSGKLKVKPTNIKGDMNNNGKIDLKDIIILIRTYLGLE